MFRSSHLQEAAFPVAMTQRDAVNALHAQCGIYTKSAVVNTMLDAIGWHDRADLTQYRLLEPAAGDGVFVVEAARRLVAACRRHGISPNAAVLRDCIRAFELHPRETRKARANVLKALRDAGVHPSTCKTLVCAWILRADFLLSRPAELPFTHAVGNPPYVRWAKIPARLRTQYARSLPRAMIGGDLFVPFLDRALDQLCLDGRCAFLCSDRWRFMRFAEHFRAKWLPQLNISPQGAVTVEEAYVRDVDAYPSILVAQRKHSAVACLPAIRSGKTLKDYGFEVKVGPALGHTSAYVIDPEEDEVEEEVLRPWIDASEISDGEISWSGRRVIATYGDDGALIDLQAFPLVRRRLERFRPVLRKRSIVRNGASWYRTIDRVCSRDWERPKLLVPEIAKVPRLALDVSCTIPSHGVYAIFAPNDNIGPLYERLSNGGLARALEGIAPKIKGGYSRCYKRFLEQIAL